MLSVYLSYSSLFTKTSCVIIQENKQSLFVYREQQIKKHLCAF